MHCPLSSDKFPGTSPAFVDSVAPADFKDQASPQEEL